VLAFECHGCPITRPRRTVASPRFEPPVAASQGVSRRPNQSNTPPALTSSSRLKMGAALRTIVVVSAYFIWPSLRKRSLQTSTRPMRSRAYAGLMHAPKSRNPAV
jgi:hypothetical protein